LATGLALMLFDKINLVELEIQLRLIADLTPDFTEGIDPNPLQEDPIPITLVLQKLDGTLFLNCE
jgi:hypothetical protein